MILSLIRTSLLPLLLSGVGYAADDATDIEFLEWLGQATELEEMGVDIDTLIAEAESPAQSKTDEETTND